MTYPSIASLHSALHAGETTCIRLVEEALQRAQEKFDLNIFVELFPESARAKAAEVDAKLQAGQAGPLAGVIMALKDNLCYA
ncbi:MAG: amidase family protein, partial [Schleiferiaceae bacterium]